MSLRPVVNAEALLADMTPVPQSRSEGRHSTGPDPLASVRGLGNALLMSMPFWLLVKWIVFR